MLGEKDLVDIALVELSRLLESLADGAQVRVDRWPGALELRPESLGLERRGQQLVFAEQPDLLDISAITQALPQLQIESHHAIDSTNTRLMSDAGHGSIAGRLCLAEFQAGGRGRRGRSWLSPYARNLAMTLGHAVDRPLTELGGLSLVVGLGLAAALENLGVRDVQLKWPNDVWVSGSKVSGILVELAQRGGVAEAAIGMGVNVSLSAAEIAMIDQPVTDLRSHGVSASRSELVIEVISRVRQSLQMFAEEGFAPFVQAFDELHHYHGKACTVSAGRQAISGTVTGVGLDGALILTTPDGEQRFHGGEVSLRPAAPTTD